MRVIALDESIVINAAVVQLKPPRLRTILSESKSTPLEAELDSEASFRKLIASHAELPIPFHPRTPRSARGRFPEEVCDDDDDADSLDMSDDDDFVGVSGTGESSNMMDDTRWMSASPAGVSMDVDMVS